MKRFNAAALRRGRFSEPGRAYLVTTVTDRRRPVFGDFVAGRRLVRILRYSDVRGASKTLAYVVMPDHFHWLFILGARQTLPGVVGTVKSMSARAMGLSRLWQPGFHDRAMRDAEDLRAVARYVVANPLRAGLVHNIGEYPLWDAAWINGNDPGV